MAKLLHALGAIAPLGRSRIGTTRIWSLFSSATLACDCPFGAIEDWNIAPKVGYFWGRCDCPFGAIEDWNLTYLSSIMRMQRAIAPLGRSRIGTGLRLGAFFVPQVRLPLWGDRGLEQSVVIGDIFPEVRLPLWGDRGLEHPGQRSRPAHPWVRLPLWGDRGLEQLPGWTGNILKCDCPFGAIEDWNLTTRNYPTTRSGAIAPLGRSRIGTMASRLS